MTLKLVVLVAAISFLFSACGLETKNDTPESAPQAQAPAPTPKAEAPHEVSQPLPELEDEQEDPLLNVDLLALQAQETKGLQLSEVQALNEKEFQKIEGSKTRAKLPDSKGHHRILAITPEVGQLITDSINKHEVVSDYEGAKYNQPNVQIGYCFGRATYVHLALLKMGVDKQSIRKIWLVGPMVGGGIEWQFHVAVTVRSTTGKWMVIDNFTGKFMEVRDWVNYFVPQNAGFNNLRVYITDPSKFSVSLSKYDRIQLGLDLPADKDWYRNYFVDLMKWFKIHKLEEVGLYDLRTRETEGK